MAGLGPVLKHGLLSRSMIEVRDSISVRQLHSYCQRLIGASLLLLFLLLVFLFFLSLPIFLHPTIHDTSLPRPSRPHHPITICFQGSTRFFPSSYNGSHGSITSGGQTPRDLLLLYSLRHHNEQQGKWLFHLSTPSAEIKRGINPYTLHRGNALLALSRRII